MRSVDKGGVPIDTLGKEIVFASYEDAAPYLKTRLGRYCSYCERTVPVSLAVEHKMPRKHYPALETDWPNLLLACSNCNSCKGSAYLRANSYVWPDVDDTFNMIEYSRSGAVKPRSDMNAEQALRVGAALRLLGLSRLPMESPNTDHRYFDRLEILEHAEQSILDLANNDTPEMRRAIVRQAKAKGGFSIWMAAFVDDPEMQFALVGAFPGTRYVVTV